MQRKIEFIAKDAESAMQEAVNKLHIPSDKIYINVLGELPEGLNCEALVDVNLTLEGKKYLENIHLLHWTRILSFKTNHLV